ncbi:MAG TPA: hypothetical protein PKM64_09785, partial [Thermoanaerobaculia bacterium]|nr:hypothetical protein [Thermoanaerobaculia bacterium]
RDFAQRADYSEDTALRIDQEVQRIVRQGHEEARRILSEQRAVLDRLSRELLEKESLEGEAVYGLIEAMTGQRLGPPRPPKAESPASKPLDAPAAETAPSAAALPGQAQPATRTRLDGESGRQRGW